MPVVLNKLRRQLVAVGEVKLNVDAAVLVDVDILHQGYHHLPGQGGDVPELGKAGDKVVFLRPPLGQGGGLLPEPGDGLLQPLQLGLILLFQRQILGLGEQSVFQVGVEFQENLLNPGLLPLRAG